MSAVPGTCFNQRSNSSIMNKPNLTGEQKEMIRQALIDAFTRSGMPSRNKYATSIGITSSDFSNIEHRKWVQNEKLLSVEKWLRLARTLRVVFRTHQQWATAPTATYRTITEQLKRCQEASITAIFCDEAGLGKTHAAREYAETHANAFYVNGGSFPRKIRFIRALAQAVGINPDHATTEEVFQDTVYYLRALNNPIIIIDEAGDLDQSTYLLLKRLFNDLEDHCGLYMLGARGLKSRIDSGIRVRRNGFEELFSRFGSRYSSVMPDGPKGREEFLREEAKVIAMHNGLNNGEELNRILTDVTDMRRVKRQVLKLRTAA